MNKILLPTDFSKKSFDVASFALEAFNDKSCEVYFLHTYQYSIYGLNALNLLHEGSDFLEKIHEKAFTKLVKQVSFFAKQAPYSKHVFKLLCKHSDLIEGIQEAIEKFEIDIVLIGTKGEDKKKKKYLEKKVNKILEKVKMCPVMTVPLNEKAWESMGLKKIKLAS